MERTDENQAGEFATLAGSPNDSFWSIKRIGEVMEYLIISSRGKFLAENFGTANLLASILSSFETEAVQVFKHGLPIAAYCQQRQCQTVDEGFLWEETVEDQHMSKKFEFLLNA